MLPRQGCVAGGGTRQGGVAALDRWLKVVPKFFVKVPQTHNFPPPPLPRQGWRGIDSFRMVRNLPVNGVLGEQSPRIPSPSVRRRQKKSIEGTFKLDGD